MILKATARAQAASNGRFPSPNLLFQRYKTSHVPTGGWAWERFHNANGRALNRDIVNITRAERLRGIRSMTETLTPIMKDHVNRVIEAATERYRRVYGVRGKGTVTIQVDAHSALWEQAIQEELARAGSEVVLHAQPAIQSVVDSTYQKVSMSLGANPTRSQMASLGSRARAIASRLKDLLHTTIERIRRVVRSGIEEGKTVFEVAEDLRNHTPTVSTNRIPTIARTEIGRATDAASKAAMKDSMVVSHISVVGCEKIERSSPRYRGIPTCNIQNVPIWDEDKLEFHINHTGCIVVSGMYRDDGSAPNLFAEGGDD